MKKLVFCFFVSLVLFSCATTVPKNIEEKYSLTSREGWLRIYFPLFVASEKVEEDEDGQESFIGGDGIVIIFPNKEVMVIDGFYAEAAESFTTFLSKTLQIDTIHYLVASHFHADHVGTFPHLMDNFIIKNFYSNGALIDRSSSNELVQKMQEKNIQGITLKKGDVLEIGEVLLEVLYPCLSEKNLDTVFYVPGKTEKQINLSSLVMKISYKDFSILFTGDLYKKGERELVSEYGSRLHVNVLKVPHHGDHYTSNSRKFLNAIKPELAIAQRPEDFSLITKMRFKSLGIPLVRVEEPGFIKIETNGTPQTHEK